MGKHTIDPQISAEHLAGAVRFATVSNADNSLTDYTKFDAFHEYLKETYPLVHKHLTLEHTDQAGLLYHWKGTGKSGAAPLLLMAHQDVVPEGDLEKWTYPPYSGTIADGKIWGRGSSDCKSNLIGQLEAVEALLEKGYEPDYDLYLSYGYMEEVAGGKIPAETLRGTGIHFGAVLDEGGGVRPGSDYGIDEKGLCTIGLCEKGYVDFELSYTAKGGHSSRPGENLATTMIAKALIAIQENPMPYRVTDTIRRRFEVLAPYMVKENPKLAELLKNPDENLEKLVPYFKKDPALDAMFHTTVVPTMLSGSAQANILPAKVTAVVNSRILTGDTVESVKKHLEDIVPEEVEVRVLKGSNASPTSLYDGAIKDLLVEISSRIYGDVIPCPEMMLGGTDARFVYDMSDRVYRFSTIYAKGDHHVHAVDEFTGVEELADSIDFYMELLTRYGETAK